MVAPLVALGAALGGGSAIASFFGSKKKNKAAAEQWKEQQRLGKIQEGYAGNINALADDIYNTNPNVIDANGYGYRYDPITKQYIGSIDPRRQQLQDASDKEELARNTIDALIRRNGMVRSEGLSNDAATEARAELTDLAKGRSGIGRIDPTQIEAILGLDKAKAINAGYDDAIRGLNAVSTRTGGEGTQAFQALARNRANDIARLGSSRLDAIEFSDRINQGRDNAGLNKYGTFANIGSNILDTGFSKSDVGDTEFKKLLTAMELQNRNKQLGLMGKETAAGIVGNAANGLRSGGEQQQQNTDYNRWAKLFQSAGDIIGGLKKGA